MKSASSYNPNRYSNTDMEGKQFGDLTVVSFNPEKSKVLRASVWNCKCACGNECYVERRKLINGTKTNCGHCIDTVCKPGAKFGKLTVIDYDKEVSSSRQVSIWKCKCDCGKICYIPRVDLIKGTRTQCPDCTNEFSRAKRRDTEDITNERFGMLVAIKYDPNRSKTMKQTVWECKCDCGNIIYATISNLKSGNTTSCGCKRKATIQAKYKIDMIGKKFGKLTVISENIEASKKKYDKFGNIESTIPYYNCECECGNDIVISGAALRSGNTTSCGYCYNHEDLTGQIFGRLKVIEYVGSRKIGNQTYGYWKCRCTCGNEVEVSTHALKSGNTKSCGCLIRENLKARGSKGIYYDELRGKYRGMIDRCYNTGNQYYNTYGGRGIIVCDRWLGEDGFNNFYSDMVNGFEPGLTIDRIDVNGPYSPDNCRWLDRKGQNYNKRNNIYMDYYGKKICLAELAEKFSPIRNINSSTLSSRLNAGYTVQEALNKPLYTANKKDNYFKENPIITKPFMFKKELDSMNLYAEDIVYNKLTGKDLEDFLNSRPIAGDFLKDFKNIEFKK